MNNNVCCSFEEFDILVKVFIDPISVPLISKGGHKTTHIIQANGNTFHLKFSKTPSVCDAITFQKPWKEFAVFTALL